jgi:hypothetical protein
VDGYDEFEIVNGVVDCLLQRRGSAAGGRAAAGASGVELQQRLTT